MQSPFYVSKNGSTYSPKNQFFASLVEKSVDEVDKSSSLSEDQSIPRNVESLLLLHENIKFLSFDNNLVNSYYPGVGISGEVSLELDYNHDKKRLFESSGYIDNFRKFQKCDSCSSSVSNSSSVVSKGEGGENEVSISINDYSEGSSRKIYSPHPKIYSPQPKNYWVNNNHLLLVDDDDDDEAC